jgi:fumarate reductase flavoprotein subunit
MQEKNGKRGEPLVKEKQDNEAGGVTRRQLIAGAAVTAGVVGGGMLLPRALQAVEAPKKWDREKRMSSSSARALPVCRRPSRPTTRGAKVNSDRKEPGDRRQLGDRHGAYNAVDPGRQKKQGIEDSIDLHYKQTLEGGDFRGDPEKVRFLVEHAMEGVEWLEKMGVVFEPKVYTVIGALWPRSHDPANKGRGGAIVRGLKNQVDKRQIPVLIPCALTGIVRQKPAEGKVLGIEAEYRKKKMYIKAKRAVVLATGGFSADVSMRSKYNPQLDKEIPTTNVRTATGEAITYSEDIGADVVGMDYIQLLVACNFYTKRYGSLTNLGIDSAVFVNTEGKRFVAKTPGAMCWPPPS